MQNYIILLLFLLQTNNKTYLSPPIPKFKQCNELIFSFHNVLNCICCTIESPMKTISDSVVFASCTNLTCILIHLSSPTVSSAGVGITHGLFISVVLYSIILERCVHVNNSTAAIVNSRFFVRPTNTACVRRLSCLLYTGDRNSLFNLTQLCCPTRDPFVVLSFK